MQKVIAPCFHTNLKTAVVSKLNYSFDCKCSTKMQSVKVNNKWYCFLGASQITYFSTTLQNFTINNNCTDCVRYVRHKWYAKRLNWSQFTELFHADQAMNS